MAAPTGPTEITIKESRVYTLPLRTRTPLRFGKELLLSIESLRVSVVGETGDGKRGTGWGEVPLNVQWLWPDGSSVAARIRRLHDFSLSIADFINSGSLKGHPFAIASRLEQKVRNESLSELPPAAQTAVIAAFDMAVHDAYGIAAGRPTYSCYGRDMIGEDLRSLLKPYDMNLPGLANSYPDNYLRPRAKKSLPVWHLVGGEDYLREKDVPDEGNRDAYPDSLEEWMQRDGVYLIKIKLLGRELAWDYSRLVECGRIALENGGIWLSVDFNCTVHDQAYLLELLKRLMREEPRIYGMLLFIEQPFPVDESILTRDVHPLTAYKPLFLDEALISPASIPAYRELGWSGAALKTCKGQSASILSAAVAAHLGMPMMVQDLTNPRLAMIAHAALASHVPTLIGLESNASQYYPDESLPEGAVHPGLFSRRKGSIDCSTISGPGIGYRNGEIKRNLESYLLSPERVCS